MTTPVRVCEVCSLVCSKYLCPRCNLPYCSLTCFKTHGTDCTNHFYQARVNEELKGQRASEADKRSIKESLCRVHQAFQAPEEEMGEPREEDDEDALLLRLSEKDESRLRLEDLTLEQRKGFWLAVAEGRLGEVELWVPWWEGPPQASVPSARPLAELTSRPSPLVVFSVLEVVLSYCYVLRLYNGDAECDIVKSVALLRDLAPSLGSLPPLSSAEQVLNRMVACVCEQESSCAPALVRHCLAVGSDVDRVLSSLAHLTRALGHVQALLVRCASKQVGALRKSSKLAARKAEFFLSWTSSSGGLVQECAAELRLAITQAMKGLEQQIDVSASPRTQP